MAVHVSCFGIGGTVCFAAEEDTPSVQGQVTVTGSEIAHTERYGPALQSFSTDGQGIQVSFLQIPEADLRAQPGSTCDFKGSDPGREKYLRFFLQGRGDDMKRAVHGTGQVQPDPDVHPAVPGINTDSGNIIRLLNPQAEIPGDAVPVCLGFI